MFLSDITLVFVFELFSNMGKKSTSLVLGTIQGIYYAYYFQQLMEMRVKQKLNMMFILREKAKEYKRNMMKICLDIFLAPII